MQKVSDYIIDFIVQKGVDHIFMLPGGGCMHLVDSVGRNKSLTFIGNLHEQAAVVGADGYAQYRNSLGVALVTTGPGGTNAITGVAGAWIDSTPLMIISGQVKCRDRLQGKGVRQMGIQEVDIISLVSPITKYAATVLKAEEILYHLEKAYASATEGRPGPVWLDIPLDIQGTMVDEKRLKGYTREHKGASSDMGNLIDRAITHINAAERPVILIGAGVRLAKAEEEFIQVMGKLKIPVLATWRMMDLFPDDEPYYFGRPGSIASRSANFIQQNADFILVLGARLDLPQVGHSYPNFAREAKKVVVDIDNAEIAKIDTNIDVSINADAKEFLTAFIGKMGDGAVRNRADWLLRCEKWKRQYPVILPEYLRPELFVNPYALMDMLSEILDEDDVIVPGSSGSCAEITRQAFRIKKGQRMINSPGLGSMGYGLPQSIGVCLASGRRRTVCIVGDGGLQHNIQELETIKRLNLPIKLFILNNNGYGAIRSTHTRFFEGRLVCCDPSSGLTLPDTCKVAAAYGLKAVKILDQQNLKEEVTNVLNMEGPVVCDVLIDPDVQMAPKLSSSARPDGTMVSKPLEDLWPFLDREEFMANMIVHSTEGD
jgi:acetolactate synthase I/II/III large subunit